MKREKQGEKKVSFGFCGRSRTGVRKGRSRKKMTILVDELEESLVGLFKSYIFF